MWGRPRPWWLACALLLACGDSEADKDPTEGPAAAANLRIGHVMVEVGHRFETAGRAASAERWGLAEYQVHEILEIFEDDMGRALLPGDCNDEVVDAIFLSLKDHQLPELRTAAGEEDADLFRQRFATVAQSCNGCHAGCQVDFVDVPTALGAEVPQVGPVVSETPTPPPAEAPPARPDRGSAGPLLVPR